MRALLILSHITLVLSFPLSPLLVSPTATGSFKEGLNKQSTALDVLKALNNSNKFASYARSGGVAIVTGGSSGIGIATVEALALTGMKVVLCARDVQAATRTVDMMKTSADKDNLIRIQQMDLSDLNSIKAAVNNIRKMEERVDLIVNNAGVMAIPTKQVTAQNFELQLGTNHIGHFYFTRLLLDANYSTLRPGGRVVTVASEAHTGIRKLNLEDLNYDRRRYSPWDAYSQSKLANVLFSKALQDKVARKEENFLSVSLHPGVIRTKLWRHNDNAIFRGISNIIMDKSVEQGAATTVFCAVAVETDLFTGGDYVVDCEPSLPNKNARDKKMRNDLWEKTEHMIESSGFKLPQMI